MPNAAASSSSTPRPSATGKPSSGAAAPIAIAVSCFIIIAALVGGVGIPDGLMLRHIVQTLPLWAAIVVGLRRSHATGWLALPCFLF